MKKTMASALLLFVGSMAFAMPKDTTVNYSLPDSVKAVQFLAEVVISSTNKKTYSYIGIKNDAVGISIRTNKENSSINFFFSANSANIVRGIKIDHRVNSHSEEFLFNTTSCKIDTFKLLLSQATDSSENISWYSGYIFLPCEKKWKFIGSCKVNGRWNTIQKPSLYYSKNTNKKTNLSINKVWVQRQNGSWKNLNNIESTPPVFNLNNHIDSLPQSQIEQQQIQDSIKTYQTACKEKEGLYYTILKEGTGPQVNLTDTVTVHYKGYLFNDGSIFDKTKEKPATFPLNRLIKGWQIAVPECKVGGKVKIVIPSGLAYSIRTRSPKIPPNSILVFEIEIVSTQPALK